MQTISAPPGQFVVIDTSVWASNLLPNDSNHVAANNWVRKYLNNGGYLVAPVLLVVETAATLARITHNQAVARKAAAHLYSFRFMRLLPIDQTLLSEAVDMAVQFSLKGADAFYVAVAKQLGIALVTLDSEQLTRPASAITTISP